MVLQITRDTFDNAVKENMEVFGLTDEEAINETVKQFETQGVDLTEILKEVMLKEPEDCSLINEAIAKLLEFLKSEAEIDRCDYVKYIQIIRDECEKGLEYKVYAGKQNAYVIIKDVMQRFDEDNLVVKEGLRALTALMQQQPDLLDDRGVLLIVDYLQRKKDNEIRRLLLKWTKECCIMHENNRQRIFNAGVLDLLKPVLHEAKSPLLRDVLAVLRALVLDDDVRVEFGKAHEHARVIASDTLCEITKLLSHFKLDELFMYDLMLTLSSLLVRTEYCKKLEDADGLIIIQEAMVHFEANDKLIRQCFKLFKTLAGNDDCKAHIIKNGAAPVIVAALNKHKGTPQTALAGLGCVAAVTLRSPDNSKALFEAGIADVIVNAMTLHPDNANVQRNGSWAIRNMVSRSRYQNKKFLELGIESLLIEDLKKFKNCEYDLKAALRDLGCEVKLKEEWTGKGGLIHTDTKKKF